MDKGDWNEYKNLILSEIKEAKKEREIIVSKYNSLIIEVTVLKVKAGMLAGLVSVVCSLIIGILIKYLT